MPCALVGCFFFFAPLRTLFGRGPLPALPPQRGGRGAGSRPTEAHNDVFPLSSSALLCCANRTLLNPCRTAQKKHTHTHTRKRMERFALLAASFERWEKRAALGRPPWKASCSPAFPSLSSSDAVALRVHITDALYGFTLQSYMRAPARPAERNCAAPSPLAHRPSSPQDDRSCLSLLSRAPLPSPSGCPPPPLLFSQHLEVFSTASWHPGVPASRPAASDGAFLAVAVVVVASRNVVVAPGVRLCSLFVQISAPYGSCRVPPWVLGGHFRPTALFVFAFGGFGLGARARAVGCLEWRSVSCLTGWRTRGSIPWRLGVRPLRRSSSGARRFRRAGRPGLARS